MKNLTLNLDSARTPPTTVADPRVTDFTFIHLTELLTDFELECPGVMHELKLRREPNDRGMFWLIYSYLPTSKKDLLEHDTIISRTMLLTAYDVAPINARHDQIIKHFIRAARKDTTCKYCGKEFCDPVPEGQNIDEWNAAHERGEHRTEKKANV